MGGWGKGWVDRRAISSLKKKEGPETYTVKVAQRNGKLKPAASKKKGEPLFGRAG